jgi:two-component system, chemotaxis family, chemotaxis protein CheY
MAIRSGSKQANPRGHSAKMNNHTINLGGLAILVADPNSYLRRIIQSMLRGFGANKLFEVEDYLGVVKVLTVQKVDALLCDTRLPPEGGLSLIRVIRRQLDNENRTMPILVMTADSREMTIKMARDAGANMVIAKPMSPKALYDRLAWIAFTPRNFIDTATYFGPDRRFKIEGYPNGVGRRKGDKAVEVAAEVGPTLAQDDIDSLFGAARSGQS